MRDEMAVGDEVLFYHSSADPPGVAGIAKVCRTATPDDFALDRKSKYFDARHTSDKPVWMMVDVAFVKKFREVVSLDELREVKSLQGMLVIKRGQRLSIQPLTKQHFEIVKRLGERKRK